MKYSFTDQFLEMVDVDEIFTYVCTYIVRHMGFLRV